ncbi:fungal calcium binding protein-domain-containing protein [Aspergillus transmontanensis]|uniref:Fungal calcium binding protein-domain-containing protein n=1 Tax=Aspergillus transmontanensis TaxID=1034304 RepID=A0A5N6WA11_9EURO|nr:fungal calcium binding protein-domain-containing protein [Aspergillus transmontanensis]
MRFFLVISTLLAVATAAPASTAQNLQDVQSNAAAFTEAKKAAGCDWLACVSSLAGESAACAAAAAELGANPIADAACIASVGTSTASCKNEEVEVDKELLLDRIVKEIHGFSLQSLPWADDNGQESDERIDYSTKKVHDWLVENSLLVNPDQERPLREKRSYLLEYFEQNPYFGGSSVDSNSSDVETVLSWEVELENLKEAHGPVSFTSRGGNIPSGKGSDDGEAYSEVDSYRPGSEPLFDNRSGTFEMDPDQQHTTSGPPAAQCANFANNALGQPVETYTSSPRQPEYLPWIKIDSCIPYTFHRKCHRFC